MRYLVSRTLPSIDTAVVYYHRFLLDPEWVADYPVTELIKPWSGEPTTVILKALRGLAQPIEIENVDLAETGVSTYRWG